MGTSTPFRFGASDVGAPTYEVWVAHARKVEALGYSTLWTGDHPGFGGMSPTISLMAAAEATTTLRIASHILGIDFRHPAMLAQEAATLDLLSQGRLELGLGSGFLESDYTALGIQLDPPAVRIRRLEEAVRILKQLFGGEPVTFAGDFYRVTDLALTVKPKQQPHPPILIGGGGRRILQLAAREASIVGFNPRGTRTGGMDLGTATAAAMEQKVAVVREAAGDRLPDLELQVLTLAVKVVEDRWKGAEEAHAMWAAFAPAQNVPNPAEILASPHFLIGSVHQIVEDLQERRERFGISYITIFGGSVDEFSPVVARLAGT